MRQASSCWLEPGAPWCHASCLHVRLACSRHPCAEWQVASCLKWGWCSLYRRAVALAPYALRTLKVGMQPTSDSGVNLFKLQLTARL